MLLAATPALAETSRTLDRIRADGVIHLGYCPGASPFSFKERDGSVRGYGVELCTRVVSAIQKQLGLSKLALEWTPLDAADRLDAVARGRVDIECGTTTISLSRMERVDFSVPIFVDGATIIGTIDSNSPSGNPTGVTMVQIGKGMTKQGTVLLGAAGGGMYKTRPAELNTKRWEVTVRMDTGEKRSVTQNYEPMLHEGDRVRVLGTQVELVQ